MQRNALRVCDIGWEIEAPLFHQKLLRSKYGCFLSVSRQSCGLWVRISCRAQASSSHYLPKVHLRRRGSSRFEVSGECSAWLDLESRRGMVTSGNALAAVDTLVRLSLSLIAPQHGWILMHGAAVALESGGWALLLGRSNAGKSTAARAFESHCDEWVMARSDPRGALAASTPYWNGTPGLARCEAIVCLEKEPICGAGRRCTDSPLLHELRPVHAVRALLPHVVRFVSREEIDRSVFANLCALARSVRVFCARCPTGDRYIPGLARMMDDAGLRVRWRNT